MMWPFSRFAKDAAEIDFLRKKVIELKALIRPFDRDQSGAPGGSKKR